jgi:hypothetical protein
MRNLNHTAPQLAIVESIQVLRQDLAQLPAAVASAVTNALQPLTSLRQNVQTALEAYDVITALQRETLDALALEMTSNATQTFDLRVKQLDTTLAGHAQSLAELKSNLNRTYQSLLQISQLPEALSSGIEEAKNSASKLTQAAQDSRQPLWRQGLILMLASLVAAALALAGRSVWDTLQLPSRAQQHQIEENAKVAVQLWSKATPEERDRLNQILERPAK